MIAVSRPIEGGDFGSAGAASRALKDRLRLAGVATEAMRRAMIASYEAEMNVVIHADGGRLEATVSDGQLDVDVVDRGPGIPAEHLPHIFERYYRGDGSRSGPGAGLGLPLVQGIVEAHGGEITVDSSLGQGSTFSFTLPDKLEHYT